eukprot:GDKH01008814.1.p3 GENE.GDKH01008814.1~~GDKH01008814.1.p3  ORF type:complete len:56 (-),score=6.85 GDKH01008814.1:29-196(-)
MGIGNSLCLFLLPWQPKSLPSFPEALTANAQFFSQLGFVHLILVFEDKFLEVIFQ